jgi:hypothetical protein
MTPNTRRTLAAASAAALVVAIAMSRVGAPALDAKVKIRVQHDERFDFRGLKTWAWYPSGAGEVKMLISADDDPARVRAQVEPIITDAVAGELAKRGLAPAPSGTAADVHVLYYLLISVGDSSQTMGQFVNTPAWGLPPISGGTTSLEIYEQGSLALDLIAVSQKSTVWRGVAQAEIDWERTSAQRQQRIRDAIRDMLAKYPPKK